MECSICKGDCIKKGKRHGIQRYQCKACGCYQQQVYIKTRIPEEKYQWVKQLNNEGCGISSISRLLKIFKSSVQRLIERIASNLKMPRIDEKGQSYEIDEIRTFCGNKKNECWIIYAINKTNGSIIDFCVGRRTKEIGNHFSDVLDNIFVFQVPHHGSLDSWNNNIIKEFRVAKCYIVSGKHFRWKYPNPYIALFLKVNHKSMLNCNDSNCKYSLLQIEEKSWNVQLKKS